MNKFNVDPLGKFEKAKAAALVEACGIVPSFALYAEEAGADTAEAFMEKMNSVYGFGFGGNMLDHGGTVSPEGVYEYPEDRPLYPLMEYKTDKGITVWLYEYALVVVVDAEDNKVMQRMD